MSYRHQTLRRIQDIHDPQPDRILVVYRDQSGKTHRQFLYDAQEWDDLMLQTNISLERVILVKDQQKIRGI